MTTGDDEPRDNSPPLQEGFINLNKRNKTKQRCAVYSSLGLLADSSGEDDAEDVVDDDDEAFEPTPVVVVLATIDDASVDVSVFECGL